MQRVLVLGGTGFVGAHVCEKLIRAGCSVVVPTRRRKNAARVQHLPGLTVLELDVHDEAALTRSAAGVDAVVNLVAILHGSAAAFDKVHLNLPQKLARACATQGVTLIALDAGSSLSGLQRIVDNDVKADGSIDSPSTPGDDDESPSTENPS
jgi:uncharacterized protein YbjT (DUF2867 family)